MNTTSPNNFYSQVQEDDQLRTNDDGYQCPLHPLWPSVQLLAVYAAPPYRSDFFVGTAVDRDSIQTMKIEMTCDHMNQIVISLQFTCISSEEVKINKPLNINKICDAMRHALNKRGPVNQILFLTIYVEQKSAVSRGV